MQIRLLIDEDAGTHAVAHNLRLRTLDVVTVVELGRSGLTDDVQLAFAQTEGRVIYTFNQRDFFRLHSECLRNGQPHAGIICAAQQRYSIGEQVRRLLHLIKVKTAEEMQNNIEFLSDW